MDRHARQSIGSISLESRSRSVGRLVRQGEFGGRAREKDQAQPFVSPQDCVSRVKWSRKVTTFSGAEFERELASRARPSSFPFVSGDTFRAMSNVIVDEAGVSTMHWREGDVLFVATKYVQQLVQLARVPERTPIAATMTVLIHNGDILPDRELLTELVSQFAYVWAVNATDELEGIGIRALPIGLENRHWNRNGLLEYFVPPSKRDVLPPLMGRKSLIFGSFRTETNPHEREQLRRDLRERGATWHDPSGGLSAYVAAMRDAIFVLSPPGNGHDCHRTWEALYQGAIPVVLSGSLARTLLAQLPILEVTSWLDFLHRSDEELQDVASELALLNRTSAYMPYWCKQL